MAEVVSVPQAELPLATPATPAVTPIVKPRFELPPDQKQVTTQVIETPAESDPEKPAQITDEAPDAPEGETPEEKVTPEQEAKRAGRRFERKLDKAYRQRAEALARADILERQLIEARQVSAPKKVDGEPTLAEFDYDPEKYAQAKADFARKAAEQELTTKQLHERQRANQQRLVSEWESKVEKVQDKYEDWDAVVGELQPTTPFTAAIMKVPNGPDVAHHLGNNRKEAERIAKLEPLEQVVEISLLSAKLSAEMVKPKAPSKAPAPIAPLTGTTPVATNVPAESDSMKEWIRKRQKQVHSR